MQVVEVITGLFRSMIAHFKGEYDSALLQHFSGLLSCCLSSKQTSTFFRVNEFNAVAQAYKTQQ